jgi:hypothetical protein
LKISYEWAIIRAFVAKLKAWVENLTLKIELKISREWAIIRAFVAKLKA